MIQMNPVHAPIPVLEYQFLILSTHLSVVLPSGLSPSGFPTKAIQVPLLSSVIATCPAHIIFDLIAPIIFGEEYRS
jgi:hypothetical protein